MKSAFLLLVLVLGAHAQTRAFDIDACVSDIENIAKSYFHATIDWLTIIGFQHALIRMGTMLNSMGYIFVHCLGIDIPEPFADIFTVYDESLMNMPLEIMDSRIVLSGQDITEQIQAHSFPNNLQSTGEFSLERCIENVETWMEKASQAVSAVVNQSDDMVTELAGMLYAAQVMVKSCIQVTWPQIVRILYLNMAEEVKLVKLFEKVTQADSTEDDIMLTLQITDRMNQRRRYCVEGIEYFKQLFKSTDVKTITKTMNLLEACVKNASIHFHRYVCSRGLIPVFVNVLKRKRKKLSVFEKMGGMYKSPPWRDIEKRALQLIQLWADTFMMDEDKFPAYMNIYRELRKERIDFPARDPNSRFMIKYEGTASPAFELAEMEENQERFEDENPRPKAPQADERERRAAEQRRKLFEEGKELTESDIPNISYADVEVLRANIDKLETATQQAKNLNELLSETNKDIYRKTRTVHKKLIILASVKAASGMDENDTMDLLKINDYISIRIENFKNAMNIYKLGGNQASIHDMLALAAANEDDFAQVPANPAGTGDLVDLGDFLDLGTDNPLDDLERFVTSAFGSQPLPPPAASNTTIPPPPQEEAKQVMALTPPPGLNLLDFDEPTQDQAPPSSSAQPAAPADEFEDFFAELARSNK